MVESKIQRNKNKTHNQSTIDHIHYTYYIVMYKQMFGILSWKWKKAHTNKHTHTQEFCFLWRYGMLLIRINSNCIQFQPVFQVIHELLCFLIYVQFRFRFSIHENSKTIINNSEICVIVWRWMKKFSANQHHCSHTSISANNIIINLGIISYYGIQQQQQPHTN